MISTVVLTTGLILMLIGIWGMLTHRNILRIIICFSLIGTGIAYRDRGDRLCRAAAPRRSSTGR